jgi:hypothetical protein
MLGRVLIKIAHADSNPMNVRFGAESVAKLDCDAGLVGGFAGSFGELDLAATLTLGKPLVSVGDDKGV